MRGCIASSGGNHVCLLLSCLHACMQVWNLLDWHTCRVFIDATVPTCGMQGVERRHYLELFFFFKGLDRSENLFSGCSLTLVMDQGPMQNECGDMDYPCHCGLSDLCPIACDSAVCVCCLYSTVGLRSTTSMSTCRYMHACTHAQAIMCWLLDKD